MSEILKIGTPVYAIVTKGVFKQDLTYGIITGHWLNQTNEDPILIYKVEFGKDSKSINSEDVFTDKQMFIDRLVLDIPELSRVKETHGLKLKYNTK